MPLLGRLERVLRIDEAQLKVDQLVVALFPGQKSMHIIFHTQLINYFIFTNQSKNQKTTHLIFCSSLSWLRAVSSIFSNLLATACICCCWHELILRIVNTTDADLKITFKHECSVPKRKLSSLLELHQLTSMHIVRGDKMVSLVTN